MNDAPDVPEPKRFTAPYPGSVPPPFGFPPPPGWATPINMAETASNDDASTTGEQNPLFPPPFRPYDRTGSPGFSNPFGPPPPPASEKNEESIDRFDEIFDRVFRDLAATSSGRKTARRRAKDKEDMQTALIVGVVGVPLIVFETYVSKLLFNWFVPSVFRGVKPINGIQAYGLSIAAFTMLPTTSAKVGKSPSREEVLKLLKARFLTVSGMLVAGSIARKFLPKR